MKEQYILCLSKLLNPLIKEFSFLSWVNPQLIHQYKLDLIKEIEDPIEEFQKDFTNLREKKANEILRNLSQILGYGLGSTPESDDLFLGILAAKYCLNKDTDEIFQHLAKFPFERLTTSKSAQMIRSFLMGNFPLEIIPFLKLLKTTPENSLMKFQFELEARKIRSFGTSSGYYFLLGVLWELKYFDRTFSLT